MPVTYDNIATQTLTSAATSITFNSLPTTYTDLRIILSAFNGGGQQLYLRFNSDSGNNYGYTDMIGNGATATADEAGSAASFVMHYNGLDTSLPTLVPIDIFAYRGATNKTVLYSWNADRNGAGYIKWSVGRWGSTSAITSITLSSDGNFAVNTSATLYGIKNA